MTEHLSDLELIESMLVSGEGAAESTANIFEIPKRPKGPDLPPHKIYEDPYYTDDRPESVHDWADDDPLKTECNLMELLEIVFYEFTRYYGGTSLGKVPQLSERAQELLRVNRHILTGNRYAPTSARFWGLSHAATEYHEDLKQKRPLCLLESQETVEEITDLVLQHENPWFNARKQRRQ